MNISFMVFEINLFGWNIPVVYLWKRSYRIDQTEPERYCILVFYCMKLMKWAEQAQDRSKWKAIVKKAKTLSEL